MWIVRSLGATSSRLIDAIQKQLLRVLALKCLFTEEEKKDFVRVMKTGLKIIFANIILVLRAI